MFSRTLCTAVACMALLNVQAQKAGPGGIGVASPAPFYKFPGAPQVTISNHGNIVGFVSATGATHVASEGYVLCYGYTVAYDLAYSEAGFEPPTTANCWGNTCIVTRITSDRVMRLRQVIIKSRSEDRALSIEMTVINQAGYAISPVVLRRQVDLDVDARTLGGTVINRFATSELDSLTAWNAPFDTPGVGSAILVRHLRAEPSSMIYMPKITSNPVDTSCNPQNIAVNGEVRGNYGGSMQYNVGTLTGGGRATVKLQYQRN
ncbi:hypothetical protein [Azohydromonas caseinilytica]|uniref:Uncharacterized protein n=1 Tax=Azohydromonas caseinilytica TaxID=2728836 RepID=A0A848FL82_9BURK|nr:hypothetical protein [Azohydromonas caseinilytica]NML18561.1 hypothetical protein [Azohydromonas caseinilytica]